MSDMGAPAKALLPFVPRADDPRALRRAFGTFATGVTVVTVASEDGPVAITANSFSSLSLDPPLILWSPDRASRRFEHFSKADHFAVHILAADQGDLCWQVVRDAHALRGQDWQVNAEGVPVLAHCLARFECALWARYDGGDHEIMVGRVLRAACHDHGAALGFFRGQMQSINEAASAAQSPDNDR